MKLCDTINDNLNIYCYSTLEYKKDNAYAWSQTTALYNVDFCVDLYNNKLPDDSWNIEETFSYHFHTNDFDRWGCNMELVRAINFHGHNISELNLHDNLYRFFSGNKNFENIYTIIKSIEVNDKTNIEKLENKEDKENNKTTIYSKPLIILPIQPRDDFWSHNNDTFRELVYLWKEQGLLIKLVKNVKHVWLNAVGDTLLYDRPTIDWFIRDNSIKYKNILFGNPVIPQEEKKEVIGYFGEEVQEN